MDYLSGDVAHKASVEAAKRRREQILALRNEGRTLAAIGALLGVSKQRVSVILKRAKAEQQPS